VKNLTEVTLSFRAMNTDVEIIACTSGAQSENAKNTLQQIEKTFRQIESTLTRFNPGSELSRLNASSGQAFKASDVLCKVVQMALEAAAETSGIFDPTILPGLIAAGYDRSFEDLSQGLMLDSPKPAAVKGASWRDISLDSASSTIFLPRGVTLDLGGIGKGWTVDYVCRYLKSFPGYVVDAGGDIRLSGTQADGSAWTVAIDDPFFKGHDLTILRIYEGAVCTSTTARRKWQLGGQSKHHLIDPRSGQPSASGVVSATIIAESAARAEIIAKTSLILGPEEGLKFIRNQPNIRGLLVLEDGSLVRSRGLEEACVVE
jgi:thiamine biosynthesis lipoprotein